MPQTSISLGIGRVISQHNDVDVDKKDLLLLAALHTSFALHPSPLIDEASPANAYTRFTYSNYIHVVISHSLGLLHFDCLEKCPLFECHDLASENYCNSLI